MTERWAWEITISLLNIFTELWKHIRPCGAKCVWILGIKKLISRWKNNILQTNDVDMKVWRNYLQHSPMRMLMWSWSVCSLTPPLIYFQITLLYSKPFVCYSTITQYKLNIQIRWDSTLLMGEIGTWASVSIFSNG